MDTDTEPTKVTALCADVDADVADVAAVVVVGRIDGWMAGWLNGTRILAKRCRREKSTPGFYGSHAHANSCLFGLKSCST